MTRLISTQMTFDEQSINWNIKVVRERFPAITVAWLRVEDPETSTLNPSDLFRDNFARASFKDPFEIFPLFVDLALQSVSSDIADFAIARRTDWDVVNKPIVEFLLNTSIIVENSPPQAIPLKELLKAASAGVIVGTPVGIALAGDNYPLMLLTVPASIAAVGLAATTTKAVGIVILGAAIGVATGLRNGLAKRIEQMIAPKKSTK